MKKQIKFLLLPLFAAISVMADPIVDTLYFQGFHNNSGSFQQSDPYGFTTYAGDSATYVSGSRVHYFSNTSQTGANVNALTPHGDNISQGYWTANTNLSQFSFAEMTIPASYTDITLSFQVNNNATSDSDWHIAIRLGSGDWYLSQDTHNANDNSWSTHAVSLTESSLWLALDFDAGETMEISAAPAVEYSTISDNITAFGFYGDIRHASSTTHRLDNFAVTGAIPEPSTYAMLFGALALAFVAVRRRIRR